MITTISEDAWTPIVYPDGGVAQVAETRYQGERLIVRRTRLVGAQAELFPNWRYHALSPTGRAPRCGWTKITAATPRWSCASATSTTGSACGIIPRGRLPPTPPGR